MEAAAGAGAGAGAGAAEPASSGAVSPGGDGSRSGGSPRAAEFAALQNAEAAWRRAAVELAAGGAVIATSSRSDMTLYRETLRVTSDGRRV